MHPFSVNRQAVAVEGVVHEDEDPMLWRLLRALLKMQDKLPEVSQHRRTVGLKTLLVNTDVVWVTRTQSLFIRPP